MYHNRHAVRIRRPKHLTELLDMGGIVQLHIRVPEVELDTVAEIRMARTPRELIERIRLERIEAAERPQPLRELHRLSANPVVLGANLGVLVIDGPRWAAEHV